MSPRSANSTPRSAGWPTRRTPVLGCHLIEENGKVIGGPQSASLVAAGQRYDKDWLFRFGQNPQDFTPHSGEFLADATEPQLRAVIGFLMVQGVKDFTVLRTLDE